MNVRVMNSWITLTVSYVLECADSRFLDDLFQQLVESGKSQATFIDKNTKGPYQREGWPLLTVETEVNGDAESTNERGPSLVGSLSLSCRYKRFLFCLWLL
jgi:hypothetical protein